jgi:glycosyltransferase involved in cell wall biosynthesis
LNSSQVHAFVSVIVPARNEEACLGACLGSLVAQSGVDFEVIVVDDNSIDRTKEVAWSYKTSKAGGVLTRPSVTVIPAPPLPTGWTGKNNAMSAGAKIARGNWLLFTDADTVHMPGSLERAVAEAEQHGAALLSYSPEQEVRGFSEKAAMPVIFAELAATYPPKKVRDPASPVAAANGQYLLISREAYDAVHGHTSIAGTLLEDVRMAGLVKSSGRKIFFRYGGEAVRTRMYRSWEQMKEGWTKNLALLFKHPARRALGLLAFWAFAWTTFVSGLSSILSGHWRAGYYLVPMILLYARVARANFRPATNVIATAAGVPLAGYLLLRSWSMQKKGGVVWKGRIYGPEAARMGCLEDPNALG